MVLPHKCVAWSLLELPLGFLLLSSFCTLVKGIRVLGVPLGSFSFTSSFLKDALDNGIQHIDAFPMLGDV